MEYKQAVGGVYHPSKKEWVPECLSEDSSVRLHAVGAAPSAASNAGVGRQAGRQAAVLPGKAGSPGEKQIN